MHQFEKLLIWEKSSIFCVEIYCITTTFPSDEKFCITSQLRRASVAIASNIAEGSSRSCNTDFSRFLEMAIGSCYEIETQLLISSDLGFINAKDLDSLTVKLEEIVKMTSKFRSSLKIQEV